MITHPEPPQQIQQGSAMALIYAETLRNPKLRGDFGSSEGQGGTSDDDVRGGVHKVEAMYAEDRAGVVAYGRAFVSAGDAGGKESGLKENSSMGLRTVTAPFTGLIKGPIARAVIHRV